MNERISGLRKFRVIVLGAALAALTTGVVQAAIPAGDGTISACYDKQSGQVRIVDPEANTPKPCGPKEIAISWNVAGTPGQDGADGADGADGQDGISGVERVFNASALNSNYDKTEYANCPDGTSVIGGGAGVYGTVDGFSQEIIDGVALIQNHPFNSTGWSARAEEIVSTDSDWSLHVYAICAVVN